jgi:hypothetical protein
MTAESSGPHSTPVPSGYFRVTLTLNSRSPRLDQVLLEALRAQSERPELRQMTRTQFKALFKSGRIRIKGQIATPSSGVAPGTTFVDIRI